MSKFTLLAILAVAVTAESSEFNPEELGSYSGCVIECSVLDNVKNNYCCATISCPLIQTVQKC